MTVVSVHITTLHRLPIRIRLWGAAVNVPVTNYSSYLGMMIGIHLATITNRTVFDLATDDIPCYSKEKGRDDMDISLPFSF